MFRLSVESAPPDDLGHVDAATDWIDNRIMSTTSMKEGTSKPSAPARQLLVDWANSQDGWVRQIALEVLASGKPVSPDLIDEVYGHFLAEKGLTNDIAPTVPTLEYQEGLGDVIGELAFRKLGSIQGVNALAEGQEIEFNSGLTMLFGENGTGKTGYARILKGLAAVRTAERILPNVHAPGVAPDPEAVVEYSVGDEEHVLEWRGETGVSPITRVCVFDSPAVRLHVDDDLSYVYTPRDLVLFRAVSEGIDAVKGKAEEGISSRRPGRNLYLAHFERGTQVYTHLETLGPATDLPELQRLATLTEQEKQEAELLKTSVAAMESGSIQDQLTSARGRAQLYDDLAKAATALAGFDAEAYNQAIATANKATDAYSKLRTTLLADAGISDSSEERWQEFVLKGEDYREHLGVGHYPAEGKPCLYCRQPLGADAAALLLRYRDFATDASRQRIDEARKQAATLLRQIVALDRPALAKAIKRYRHDDLEDKVLLDSETILASLDLQAVKWEAGETVDWTGLVAPARTPRD